MASAASPPPLYDTSTSTADSGSPPGLYPRTRPVRSSSHYSAHSLAAAAKAARGPAAAASWAAMRSSDPRPVYANARATADNIDEYGRHLGHAMPAFAQSEPGVLEATEQDRFSGYVSKFAELDARVSRLRVPHAASLSSEEKKEDHVEYMKKKSSRHAVVAYPDPEPVLLEQPASGELLPAFETRGRTSSPNVELSRSRSHSNNSRRTRDLAQRFEQRGGHALTPESVYANSERFSKSAIMTSPSSGSLQPRWSHPDESHAETAKHLNYQERSEIETPMPARVKDLKQKLWGPNESLQVAVQPSIREQSLHNRRRRHSERAEAAAADALSAAGTASTPPLPPSRTARSLSPKTSRRFYDSANSGDESNYSHSQRSRGSGTTSRVFKSKFYEAAQRGLSTSPARSSTRRIRETNSHEIPRAHSDHNSVQHNSNKSVDTLMARISAVNRDDPTAALAQIDAILRGESNESVAARVSPPIQTTDEKPDDEEDHSSDGSSVSSITNPTFQGHKVNNVPTSSSRNPRPSQLNAYTAKSKPDVAPVAKPTSGSSKRKKKTRSVNPPDTIRLSSSKDKSSSSKDKNKKESPPPAPAAPAPAPSTFMTAACADVASLALNPTNSSELADKIRRWDELSTPGVPSQDGETTKQRPQEAHKNETITSSEPTTQRPQPPSDTPQQPPLRNTMSGRVQRPHPWDSSIPVRMGNVETRDTSMEMAVGVETRFTPKYSPVRELRKERLNRERETLKATRTSSEEEDISSKQAREVLSGDSFAVDPKLLSKNNNNNNQESTARQQNAMALADDFDSAWVSVPNFFAADETESPPQPQAITKEEVKKGEHPSKRNLDVPDQLVTPPRTLRREAEVQTFSPKTEQPSRVFKTLTPPQPRPATTMASAYDQGTIGTSASSTESTGVGGADDGVEVALAAPRRGIRALLTRGRRGNMARETIVLDQESSGSSSGKQSHSSMDDLEMPAPPTSRGRGRRRGASPPLTRSRSLDDSRVRNPGLARKFGRFLRVYDSNNERAYI